MFGDKAVVILLLLLLGCVHANDNDAIPAACPSRPTCPSFSFTSLSSYTIKNLWGQLRHPLKCSRNQYDFTDQDHREEAVNRLNELLSQVVGQKAALREIKNKIISHISRTANRPLILLFSGDNGVGKTMTANLISLALSLRCADSVCDYGDSTLVITAPESNTEARDSLARRVTEHARRYPRGIVIINEVLLLKPNVAQHLAPLFGRGSHFHDYPDDPLNGLIVILTTDFGKDVGITQGKSLADVGQLARKAMSDQFGKVFATDVSPIAFAAISYGDAIRACKNHILNLPCRNHFVNKITVTDDAAEAMVEHLFKSGALVEDNVREVAKLVESKVDGAVEGLRITQRSSIPQGVKVSVKISWIDNHLSVKVRPDISQSEFVEERHEL